MQQEILKRWRLILGGAEAEGTGASLSPEEQGMDATLDALYEFERRDAFAYGEKKGGGREAAQPQVARWLGDIRKYFPQSVVKVLQNDALKQPKLGQMLLFEPEILEQTVPDVHLVATLLEMSKLIPSKTRDTARRVVQYVVDELMLRLEYKTVQAITGALHRSVRNRRPRFAEMDWNTTILKNLRHYQPQYKTIIPEVRIGYGRKNRRALKHIILCIDQSGSMGTSVVYSAIFGAVLASIPTVKTHMVVFDTQVADLTASLHDPVDLLFGVQLGGGTNINAALRYCQGLITKPDDTILVLISDLEEGGDARKMMQCMEAISFSGVQMITLLALNDDGTPAYNHAHARFLAKLNTPVFACTPDVFPDLMAAAIANQDLMQWMGDREIVARG